jgi:PAS domain-containing protein
MEFPGKSNRLQTVFKVFGKILDSIREPLVFLDPRLQVVKANRSFYQTFKVEPEETEGMLIFDLGNRQWDILKLRKLLEEILPQNSVFDDLEVEHSFETIGRKVMHLNARMTSPCWWNITSKRLLNGWARPSSRFPPRSWQSCRVMAGQAISGNWKTSWNGR